MLITAVEKYRITVENMYNFDKKRFIIGIGQVIKRIIIKEKLWNGKIIKVSQDGNRKWISLLVGICIVLDGISPAHIY